MNRNLLKVGTVVSVFGCLVGCQTLMGSGSGDSNASAPASGEGAGGAKGGLRYSITVSKFENEAGWSGHWDIGDGFKTIMTAALDGSGKFIVLGDSEMRGEAMKEQDLVSTGRMAGGRKAPQKGRMTPAQLLVRGSVTHVQDETTGGGGGINLPGGIRLGGSAGKAEINMTMYLVDSATGQVKASAKVVGQSGRKGIDLGYHGGALGGVTGNLDMYKKDNVGKACENAVAQAVDIMVKKLEKIPWQASVVTAAADKVALNRGTREGITDGMKFDVGTSEEVVDPDSGETLDVTIKKVGAIEINEVKEKICYGKPIEGAGKIEKGMLAFPAKK
jgi:curli biogenesis system outer membrane secretion channel CsgG